MTREGDLVEAEPQTGWAKSKSALRKEREQKREEAMEAKKRADPKSAADEERERKSRAHKKLGGT